MTQTALVTKYIAPGICEVRVLRLSACAAGCDKCTGCAAPAGAIDALAYNAARARPGDRVLIESSTGGTMAAAAIVYLLPVLLFFLGWFLHPAAGGLGLLLGVGVCFAANRYLQKKGGLTVRVIEILPD